MADRAADSAAIRLTSHSCSVGCVATGAGTTIFNPFGSASAAAEAGFIVYKQRDNRAVKAAPRIALLIGNSFFGRAGRVGQVDFGRPRGTHGKKIAGSVQTPPVSAKICTTFSMNELEHAVSMPSIDVDWRNQQNFLNAFYRRRCAPEYKRCRSLRSSSRSAKLSEWGGFSLMSLVNRSDCDWSAVCTFSG